MYWLFGTLVYFDGKLPRSGGRGKDLGLPTGHNALASLKEEGEGVREGEENGRRGGSVNF